MFLRKWSLFASTVTYNYNKMFYIIIIAVQIHFDHARKHWVSSSCINGIVQLYDSSSTGTISDSLQFQIVAVYKDIITEDALMVTIISMQQ